MMNFISFIAAVAIFLSGFLYSSCARAEIVAMCFGVRNPQNCINGVVVAYEFKIESNGEMLVTADLGSFKKWVKPWELIPQGRMLVGVEVKMRDRSVEPAMLIYYR